MTPTTATLTQLTRAVLDAPDDDTVRLVFADALDEAGEAARAELIRVQCELKRRYPSYRVGLTVDGVTRKLVNRERELLAIAKTWERVPCPERVTHPPSVKHAYTCRVCGGTNDLLQESLPCDEGDFRCGPRTVSWQRGFPVVSCESGDVWREGTDFGASALTDSHQTRTVPTPWAREIAREFAVGLRLVDREPYHNGSGYAWFDQSRERPVVAVPESANLPTWLFQAVTQYPTNVRWTAYHTREAAVDALAISVAMWARA